MKILLYLHKTFLFFSLRSFCHLIFSSPRFSFYIIFHDKQISIKCENISRVRDSFFLLFFRIRMKIEWFSLSEALKQQWSCASCLFAVLFSFLRIWNFSTFFSHLFHIFPTAFLLPSKNSNFKLIDSPSQLTHAKMIQIFLNFSIHLLTRWIENVRNDF